MAIQQVGTSTRRRNSPKLWGIPPGVSRLVSDEDAYMALALNNAQGELNQLEIGWHALGFIKSGGTVRTYADALGDRSKERNITYMVAAARVVAHMCDGLREALHRSRCTQDEGEGAAQSGYGWRFERRAQLMDRLLPQQVATPNCTARGSG